MNIFSVCLLIFVYLSQKVKNRLKEKSFATMSHADRRCAYIEWRHWVSGTLPTVLIVDRLVLLFLFSFFFSKKVVVDQSHFLHCPTMNKGESNAGACEVDFH